MKAGSLTVGETLSHARRARGLSVDDVATDTCIRATLIRAIEADNFDLCGGAVYARGHVRSIARVVGIDPEPLIGEIDGPTVSASKVVTAVAVVAQPTDHDVVLLSDRRQPNWTLAMAAALVVVCGVALIGLFSSHSGSQHPAPGAGTHKAVHRVTPAPTPTPATNSAPPTTTTAVPASKATMRVRTLRGQSWLSISTKTGKQLYLGMLAVGQQKAFSNRHGLTYVIGNAPAVDLIINGNDIGSPPASGAVARGAVNPGAVTVHTA